MNRKRVCYLLLVLLVDLDACRNPLDGITISLKDPIQAGVVECRVYDPAGNPRPGTTRILMAGPNASQVVTTLDNTKFKINDEGVMLLAPSPTVTISPAQPFRFTVVLETPGYLTVVQPFLLTSADRQGRYLPLISFTRPPDSVTPARQVAGETTTDGILTGSLSLSTTPSASAVDQAGITIQPGTVLTDREGAAVSGKLTTQLVHTNDRTGNSAWQLPGGTILNNVERLGGGPSLGTLRVQSIAGSLNLMVFNQDYQLVHTLSKPGRLTMELNPATINGAAGRAIQAGDSIPLFRYDDFVSSWQQQPPGLVVRNPANGHLVLQTDFTQAAAYIAAWTLSVCKLGPVFAVTSKLTDVDVNYFCQLVDSQTNTVVSEFFTNVNNGVNIGIYDQEPGHRYKLRVYDYTDAWGKGANGGLIAESGVATSCDPTPVAIDLTKLPVPPSMQVTFQFSCPADETLDEASLPSLVKTQYSDVGKENWHDLLTATRTQRSITSYKIQLGRRYDFRASLDGGASWPLRQNDYLVDKPDWSFKIRAEIYCKK